MSHDLLRTAGALAGAFLDKAMTVTIRAPLPAALAELPHTPSGHQPVDSGSDPVHEPS
ncbi:hypothetical protein AB0G85_33815 [Streptomyces sioyaensis]|uniref:hypothetical protein n=1 Tax=Streptomyces sioyaensis TaxID=67364 RepID=UPI0033D7310F